MLPCVPLSISTGYAQLIVCTAYVLLSVNYCKTRQGFWRTNWRMVPHPPLFSTSTFIEGTQSWYFQLFWPYTILTLNWRKPENNKQLLDEVFVISRIINWGKGYQITLTETLIILDITKTESNNCFIIHWTKKIEFTFLLSSLTASNTKRLNLTWLPSEIMHRGHTWHDYPWPWVSVTWWLLYNLQLWRHGRWFWKFTVRFRPIRKELESSMYNNKQLLDEVFVISRVIEVEVRVRVICSYDVTGADFENSPYAFGQSENR